MKSDKGRLLRLLLVISLIITICFIRVTFAKYQEKLDTTYSGGMKGWYITLNDTDIYNQTNMNEIVSPVFCDDLYLNNYVASGVIVPGSEQYLLFVIDYSKVNVKFNVKISIDQTNTEDLKYFSAEGYTSGSLNASNEAVVDNRVDDWNDIASNDYAVDENIDAPNLENKIRYYKVYVNWDDTGKDGYTDIVENGVAVEKNDYDTTYVGESIEESTKTKLLYKAVVTFKQVNEIAS